MARKVRLVCWFILTVVISFSCAAAAFLWSAKLFPEPLIFITIGTIVYLLVLGGITWLIFKRRKAMIYYWSGVLFCAACLLSICLPLLDLRTFPEKLPGESYWTMDDGSRIAYIHINPRQKTRSAPILFIHGGPGTPNMKEDARYFAQLSNDGFTVYVYDQAGSGSSTRLQNPLQYTEKKAVSEIEEIRKKIGAQKWILIGHSNGAKLAAQYISQYRGHTEKAIFSSPGSLDPADKSGGNIKNRLSFEKSVSLYTELLQPRVLTAYILLQVNPIAAHSFAGDKEMDARFVKVYQKTESALHCRKGPGKILPGVGFYANQAPQSLSFPKENGIPKRSSDIAVPALVIKGSCDYLSWASAANYQKVFKNTKLMYIKGGGHNVYEDKPGMFLSVIRAFLKGEALPIKPITDQEIPSDYQGEK